MNFGTISDVGPPNGICFADAVIDYSKKLGRKRLSHRRREGAVCC